MLDILMMALGQLAVGFIISAAILLVCYVAYDFVVLALSRNRQEARMPGAGDWQYTDAPFDKITEFRNDFV